MIKKVGNKKVEKRAVDIVKTFIDDLEYLDHDFKDDDKGISWDGDINLYHGNIDKKENFDGSVKVQIKGRTTHNKRLQDKHKFNIDRRDLENYLKIDGTLFLEVLFKEDCDYKLYYASLLPYNLRNLLKEKPNSKNEIKLKVKEVKDSAHLYKIVRTFFLDREQQKKISDNVFEQQGVYINDQAIMIKSYNFSNAKSIFELIGEKHYFYQYDDKNNIISINYGSIEKIDETLKINIIDKNGNIFYSSAKHSVTSKDNKIVFGKAFELDNKNHKFNVKFQGSLSERMKQLDFINSLINNDGFYINECFLSFEVDEKHKEQLLNQYDLYSKIKQFLLIHNIKKDLELDDWESKDINELLMWVDAIDNSKPLAINQFDISSIGHIKIRDLIFSVFALKREDGNFDVYSIWNSNLNTQNIYKYKSDKVEITTQKIYSILNKEAYIADDVNINEMIKRYDKEELTENEEILLNFQVLELIKAYDITHNEKLLDYANYLLNKIKNFDEFHDVAFINYVQIHKRKEKLTDEMTEKLIKIRDASEDDFTKISANLLIGNIEESKLSLSKLSHEKQIIYKSYPIAIFLKG